MEENKNLTPEEPIIEPSEKEAQKNAPKEKKPIKKPLIIGIIVGIVVLAAGLYIVRVELPYRQRKKAYQRKYGRNNK